MNHISSEPGTEVSPLARMNTEEATENSAFYHEATKSVIIQRSSLDQATPLLVTAKTSSFDHEEAMEEPNEPKLSNVFVWGDNSHGQLSIRASKTQQVPDPVAINLSKLGRVTELACGAAHTVFVSDSGFIFAMGDNTHSQLGFPATQASNSHQPMMVSGISPRPGRTIEQVQCSEHTSFALIKSARSADADEVYSWGSTKNGIAGRMGSGERPSKVEFAEVQGQPLKISQISVGQDHAQVLTESHEVHVWGANSSGQLGLGDTECRSTPTLNPLLEQMDTVQISCGKQFSFLISGQNEIMVTGKLPFTVQTEQGEELDYIFTFQSIAQFDQRVKILQVESSRFASLVVDPVEEGQPKELFLWGQSPLGVFNELTPLNQLFAGSYEQNQSSENQSFNVRSVRNGLNFCVFVDEDSGMTYQIGAEHMIDPYVDDALVSLSELRDARFSDCQKFACGDTFVIGESLTTGSVLQSSPMKRVNESLIKAGSPLKSNAENVSSFKQHVSPIKKIVEEDTVNEVSIHLASSPNESKQSFPQRALYHGSISPSTPNNQSMLSYSEQKSLKLQHKELVGTLRNINGCIPSKNKTPKGEVQQSLVQLQKKKSHERTESCFEDARVQNPHKKAQNEDNSLNNTMKEREFNKTGEVPVTRADRILVEEPSQILIDEHPQLSEAQADTTKTEDKNMCQDDDQSLLTKHNQQEDHSQLQHDAAGDLMKTPERVDDQKFTTQMKNESKPSFSPEVSPINGRHQEMMSCAGQQWNDCMSNSQPTLSHEKLKESVSRSKLRERVNKIDDAAYLNRMKIEDSNQKMRYQMPLQMHPNHHMVYQSYPHQADHARSPDGRHGNSVPISRYLPVQQQPASMHSTPQRGQAFQTFQNALHMNYTSSQQQQHQMAALGPGQPGPTQQPTAAATMMPSYDPINQSGFLNMSQHQQLAEQQSYYYEMMMKEKVESTQLMAQLKEAQRQLEKSRKDYAKLLSQVDEDQEETAHLKEKVRKQEAKLSEVTIRSKEQDLALEKLVTEKAKLEAESKQASKANSSLQSELLATQQRLKDYDNQKQSCKSKQCRQNEKDLDLQLQKRTKEIYELTVKLGCLQTECGELKSQLEDKSEVFEQRLDSSRIIMEQELQDACSQIKDLSEAFQFAQDQLQRLQAEKQEKRPQDTHTQTVPPQVSSKAVQVGCASFQQEEDFPRFLHSVAKVIAEGNESPAKPLFEMPSLPKAIFESVNERRQAEQEQSFEASISFIQQEQQEQQDSSYGLDSAGEMSLKEFKYLEQAAKTQRQSMELPQLHSLPMAQKISHVTKQPSLVQQYLTFQNSESDDVGPKPAAVKKHNFTGNRSNASIEPKIIRSSKGAGNSSDKSGRNTARLSSKNYARAEQQRSVNVVNNFADKSHSNLDLSISNVQEQPCSDRNEESCQTFKPITTCPNDRYSLKRHQEIFLESHVSQLEDVHSQMGQSENSQAQQAQARRAKSNSDTNSSNATSNRNTELKARRLRHQRKAEAKNRDKSDDDTSYRSIGVKSSMTTPHRTNDKLDRSQKLNSDQLSGQNYSSRNHGVKKENSRLKQPTPLRKSAACNATLNRIDSQSKIHIHDHLGPMTTRNSTVANQACTTPKMSENASPYFAKTARGPGTSSAIRQRPTNQPNILGHSQSQSHFNTTRSVTPRIKSQSTLQGNAPTNLGRHSKQSSSSNQQLSATARRVAYEQRRKLAMQTMKEMKKSSQRTNANVNRQARAAVANLPITDRPTFISPESLSTSQEEPMAHPPQQAVMPVMSVCEDSELTTLMSARNMITIQDMSPVVPESDPQALKDRNHMLNTLQVLQAKPQQNPFLATPATQDSLTREAVLEMRKSKTALSSGQSQSNAVESNSDSRQPQDQHHLHSMKSKLAQIQTNKMMLESKIKEYESQLMRMSSEPESQEILAKFKPGAASMRAVDLSADNLFSEQNISGSELTLGESSRNHIDRQTPRHIFSTQERQQKRTALQQISNNGHNINQMSSHQQNTSASFNTKQWHQQNSQFQEQNSASSSSIMVVAKPFRECMKAPPMVAPNRIKAPPSIMPRTHYANQPIFRR